MPTSHVSTYKPPVFSSLREVVRHLTQAGYKVSKSKISRDKKKNAIRVEPDGTILESEVRVYAGTLERARGDIKDLSDIHAQKTAKEVESIELKIAKQQFDLEKETGRYILRRDFEAELASRAVVFDAGFRHMFNMKVREWIALVGGKSEKSSDLLDKLNQALDEQLNSYASLKTYHVIFSNEEN